MLEAMQLLRPGGGAASVEVPNVDVMRTKVCTQCAEIPAVVRWFIEAYVRHLGFDIDALDSDETGRVSRREIRCPRFDGSRFFSNNVTFT